MFTHTSIWWPWGAIMAGWFVLSIALGIVRALKRNQGMVAAAQALGLTYTAWNNQATAPKFGTPLFQTGSSLGLKNFMTGAYGGLEVQVFDYSQTSAGATSSASTSQTVAVYTQNVDLPVFALGPGGLAAKILDALEHQNVELNAGPEFSRHYSVRGPDTEKVRALFNEPLISFIKKLDHSKPWHIEGCGKTLVIYHYARCVKPAKLKDFLQDTSSIAQSFFALASASRTGAFFTASPTR